jgi:hypothetical protein
MWRRIGIVALATTCGLGGGLVARPIITGAASPPPKSLLVSITPARLLDTRAGSPTVDGIAQGGGKLGSGLSIDLPVAGRAGIPNEATAVILNVTALDPSLATFLTVWPTGTTRPLTSNLNPTPGQPPTPNLVTVGLGTGAGAGKVSIFNLTGTVDVLADVMGYYVEPDGPAPVTLGNPGAAWVPNDVGVVTFSGPCVQLAGGNGSFRTIIPVPVGSTITHVAFSYLNAGANTTTFTLFKSDIAGATNDAIVPATNVAAGDGTLDTNVAPVVVGPGEGIYARAVLDATSFACGVEVTYDPPA